MIPLAKPAERRAKRPRPQGESKAADCEEKDPCAHHGPPATEKDDGTVQADQSSVQIKGVVLLISNVMKMLVITTEKNNIH